MKEGVLSTERKKYGTRDGKVHVLYCHTEKKRVEIQ
jgi:hypothetical protein